MPLIFLKIRILFVFWNGITLLTHVYVVILHDPQILIPCFVFVRQCLLPEYVI